MISSLMIQNSITECATLIHRMEEAAESGPKGSLFFRTYPTGMRVPFLSIGSGKHRVTAKVDPEDVVLLQAAERKAFARKLLPVLRNNLKALEQMKSYQTVNLYMAAEQMGPEFKHCADHFLGNNRRSRANPVFDCLQERNNIYDFAKNSVQTEHGIFRTKSESIDARILTENGIDFKYEVLIQVGTKLINVDFVVNLYWKQQIGIIEHHGMLDDHKYRKHKMDNLSTMMNHGIYPGQNLLILSESEEYGFDEALAERLIRAFCLPPCVT